MEEIWTQTEDVRLVDDKCRDIDVRFPSEILMGVVYGARRVG